MAPQVGLEPTTLRLTAGCSAIELLRSVGGGCVVDIHNIIGGGWRELLAVCRCPKITSPLNDNQTLSPPVPAACERVDLEARKRPRLGGKEPSDDDLGWGFLALWTNAGELKHGAQIAPVSALGTLNRGFYSLELVLLHLVLGVWQSLLAGGGCVATVLSLLRNWIIFRFRPTACAVGCILSPLRGWFRGCAFRRCIRLRRDRGSGRILLAANSGSVFAGGGARATHVCGCGCMGRLRF